MRPEITAWRPHVTGIHEVFHARFTTHAYPSHTHDAWTLLIVDDGVVRYDLDRHEHGALRTQVTLLPPGVPHDGRSARPEGFRKRVLYLANDALAGDLVGAAVDHPSLADPLLRDRIHQLHEALGARTEDLEAQSRFALIRERLRWHLHDFAAAAAGEGHGRADGCGSCSTRACRTRRRSTRPPPCSARTPRRWCGRSAVSSAFHRTATSPAAGSNWHGGTCSPGTRRPKRPPSPASTTRHT